MVRDFETMKARVKAQATQKSSGGTLEFEEIALLDYLEYFKNQMLFDNAPIAVMTLV
jgi:hypothetical protein